MNENFVHEFFIRTFANHFVRKMKWQNVKKKEYSAQLLDLLRGRERSKKRGSKSNNNKKKRTTKTQCVFRLYFLRPRLMEGSSPFSLVVFRTCFNYIIRVFLWTNFCSAWWTRWRSGFVDGHENKVLFLFRQLNEIMLEFAKLKANESGKEYKQKKRRRKKNDCFYVTFFRH